MKTRSRRHLHNDMTRRPKPGHDAGFSLVELMIAMVIVTLLLSAVYAIYASLSRSYTTQNVSAEVQQNIRAAIDLMAEDIMMAGLDPDGAADAKFEAASATNVRLTIDRNMNGAIDDTDQERVTYNLSAATLRQILYEGTASADLQPFIDNVTDFQLSYLDADNNDLGDPVSAANLSRIRSVSIRITVDEPAGRDEIVQRTYDSRIRCRNLGG